MTHPNEQDQHAPAWSSTQEWLNDLDRDPDDVDPVDLDTDEYGPDSEPEDSPYGSPPDDEFAVTPESSDTDDYPLAAPHREHNDDPLPADDPEVDNSDYVVDTTEQPEEDTPTTIESPRETPRFNKALAGGFLVFIVVTTVAVTSILLGMKSGPAVQDAPSESVTKVTAAPAEPAPPPPGPAGPTGIPFTASAPGCLPGSTAAQAVASGDPTQAWVCVRGGVDGQVLDIDLGRTMVVTAIRITPGWVGADASGADQWLQHRVLTRVSWILTDHGNAPTPVPQNTGNVHGEAPQPMPGQGVLASKITMIVLETSRAPADAPPAGQAPGAPGNGDNSGILDDVLGAPLGAPPGSSEPQPPVPGMPAGQAQTDPADNTFAVSSITIEGHSPIPS